MTYFTYMCRSIGPTALWIEVLLSLESSKFVSSESVSTMFSNCKWEEWKDGR